MIFTEELACVASVSSRVIVRNLEREQKKWKGEEPLGSFTPLPFPLHSFFCSRSSFLNELARNRLLRRLTVLFLGFIPLAAFFTNNIYYFSVIFLLRPPLTPL